METSSNNQFLILSEQENGSESPPSAIFNKFMSSSSPKKSSRRSIHKRVVSVPLNLESNSNTPPSDSWAWRKYGQKPIKGSPYPRGYYRCSSSKGCPARKQVERSNVDPTVLVVTYSCEHNHPIPASRNSHHHHHSGAGTKPGYQKVLADPELESNADEKISDLASEEMVMEDEFSWFNVMETTTSTVLESQIFKGMTGASEAGADFAMFFPMKEEDESLFADLGELPECSAVFGPGVGGGGGGGGRTFQQVEEQLPPALSPTVVWGNKLNSAATC